MQQQVPGCTSSRQGLRSALSDFFPDDPKQIHAILAAYDSDAPATLHAALFRKQRAFGLVEKLRNEYEIAEDIATEAIIAWCLIPVHDAVANALEKPPVQSSRPLDGHPLSLTTGIYRAGNDIPIGTLLLRYDGETLQTFFYICEKFQKQTHIEIAEGEYLVLDGYDAVDGFVLTATKME